MLASLKRRMAQLRVGDPLDKNTDIGAINSAEQLSRIRTLSDIGCEEGAEHGKDEDVEGDERAETGVEAGGRGDLLPEIAQETQAAHAPVGLRQLMQDARGFVLAPVVHENEFELA